MRGPNAGGKRSRIHQAFSFPPMAVKPIPQESTWNDIGPLYEELRDRPLNRDSLRQWISDFSALDEAVDEAFSLSMISYTADTRESDREKTYKTWATEILPPLYEVRVALGRRMLDFADDLPDLELFLRELRTDVEI